MTEQTAHHQKTVTGMAESMSSFKIAARKVDSLLQKLTVWIIVTFVAAMVICIWISVFSRYVVGDPVAWGEQLAKYFMIWAAMVGSSLAIREGAHIAISILVDRLPRLLARCCTVIAFFLSGAFLAVATYQGAFWAAAAAVQTDHSVWNMSLSIPYSAIPVGSGLMLIQLLVTLANFPKNGQ